ncbi:GNAT family N-acetyltransferase [Bacillus ndiopicus]|uniref:GNAT family N-acetyltransferase n=1 Tax=Bacillus ndiopicus TaxID=1347368 RepID=UPI0005AAB2B9|nr:GNAT family N-acetyltransferase [Bacillus ndiopicus]
MEKIKSNCIQPNLRKLLSFATSEENIEREYELYMESPVRALYGYYLEDEIVGCIGVEFLGHECCEIKHIAVAPNYREKGMGREMIDFIKDKYSLSVISAETDKDAVNFYKNCGFKIKSLGEKHPGVERFECTLKNK